MEKPTKAFISRNAGFQKKEDEFLRFRRTLEEWADSFNINKLWILRRAFQTVIRWKSIEERCGKIGRGVCTYRHFHGYKSPNYSMMNFAFYLYHNEEFAFHNEEFNFPEYDPMTENAEGYEERAVDYFRDHLDRYIKRVEGYYQEHAKRRPARNEDRLHCEWQARKVIQTNLSIKEIAEICGVSKNTFNAGIKNKFKNTDIPNEKRK